MKRLINQDNERLQSANKGRVQRLSSQKGIFLLLLLFVVVVVFFFDCFFSRTLKGSVTGIWYYFKSPKMFLN